MLEDLPQGQPLETPLHPKRVRVLPGSIHKPRIRNCIFCMSLTIITTSPSHHREETAPVAPLSPPRRTPVEMSDMVPSPALHVECGASSGASTPKSKRPVIPSSSSRPLRDNEIHNILNYGSEEESDDEDEGRITRWKDTCVNEIYTYFAIVLAMGMVVKSRIEEYWNLSRDIFSTPGFHSEMSLDRFLLLSMCLHFNNNNNYDPAVMTRSEAKLFKVKLIIDHLDRKFSELYTLSQNAALDESLTMWKGWLDINQFIRNKEATVGIKTYEVCESHTGYLWRFEVHAVHDTSDPQEGPVSALARELKSLGFDCVGTLRTNRQFVPTEVARIAKSDMAVGQVVGCTSGDVDIMVWRDKNRVAFISTYHGILPSLERLDDNKTLIFQSKVLQILTELHQPHGYYYPNSNYQGGYQTQHFATSQQTPLIRSQSSNIPDQIDSPSNDFSNSSILSTLSTEED
ncbi:unnamed protein product [Arctia plantaginis]|uniref:PiggyBac transposable element-derived protein domain-containing protein n=1 Tax=Arctia plantaginis TaxID=874455 RepID=A0A8S1AVF6_ARCPL|nr:unnamed protein product [Arctia plantaginis]